MTAPDKIFMPNELLSEEWTRHIEGQDTEYIRKDAILKWFTEYADCLRQSITDLLSSKEDTAKEMGFVAFPYDQAYTDNDEEYDGNFCNRLPYTMGYRDGAEWMATQIDSCVEKVKLDAIDNIKKLAQ